MRIHQIDDRDCPTHENTETASNHHQPEAPPEGESEDGLLQPDEKRSRWEQLEVEKVAEEQSEACQGDHVSPVPRNHDEQEIGENPESKCHPEEDASEVPSISVVPAPAETFRVHSEIFSHGQDGEGKSLCEAQQPD